MLNASEKGALDILRYLILVHKMDPNVANKVWKCCVTMGTYCYHGDILLPWRHTYCFMDAYDMMGKDVLLVSFDSGFYPRPLISYYPMHICM